MRRLTPYASERSSRVNGRTSSRPNRFLSPQVVSAEQHGEGVTLVLELRHAEVHIRGQQVNRSRATG
jgi:hypothetical protein